MSDSKGEPTRGGTQEPPDSRLTERLLARATHSLGVIDVRHAEAHYARIMDWLAARTPLLEHLRSRYGLTEADGVRQLGLAFADAQGVARAQGTDEGVRLSVAPNSFEASTSEQTFTAVAHVPEDPSAAPSETFRIGRRGVPTFSPANPENIPGAGTHTGRSEGAESTVEGESTLEPDSPNPEQARGLRASPPAKEIPATSEQPGAGRAPGAAQATQPPSPSTSPPPLSTSSPREAAPSPPTSAGEATTPPATRAGETRAHVDELSVDTGEVPAAAALAARVTRRGANLKASNEAATAGVPLVVESSGANRGAREASASAPVEVPERVSAFATSDAEAARSATETPLPLARSRELTVPSRDGEAATSRGQSTLPLATDSGDGARAGETAHRPRAPAAGVAASEQASAGVAETFAPARAGASPAGINVERLTEQVSRHLARRLLVERERRGLGRK